MPLGRNPLQAPVRSVFGASDPAASGRGRGIVLAVAALAALSGCERRPPAASEPESRPRIGILAEGAPKPDIIMIVVDALRADRLGAYGHNGGLSPTMDALAAAGVTFERCVSAAPWTLPSVATLFTSYYPGVHKATSYTVVSAMDSGRQAYQAVLSEQFQTLAEVLQAAGYQTAGFCAAKFLRGEYGFGQGFEHWDTSFAENTVRGEVVNRALFDWVDRQRDASRPLFVYLHYMDVHGPYNAAPRFMDPLMEQVEANPHKQLLTPKEFAAINQYLNVPPPEATDPGRHERLKGYREYWVARYEAGVKEMDFYLGQLIEGLKSRGLWEQAYVIFTADHGEALCEHGLWEHGYSQYQTDLHVPLVLRWPGMLPAGKRIRRLASLIDIMPTLLEQLRLPAGEELQGRSLVDHVSDRLSDKPLVAFAEGIKSGPGQYALLTEATKLIVTQIPARPLPDGTMAQPSARPMLFNLASDPGEKYDIADQEPEIAKQMVQLMFQIVAKNRTLRPGVVTTTRPVDEATRRQLESLGYAGGTEEADEPAQMPPAATQPATAPTGPGDAGHPGGSR